MSIILSMTTYDVLTFFVVVFEEMHVNDFYHFCVAYGRKEVYQWQGRIKHLVGPTHFTMPGPQSLC